MEQFNDISKHIEKAQGDKARFLESKKGLLPHFEFPAGEDKEEKHFSKETLLADVYEERIEKAKEMMQNPILLENVYRNLQDNAAEGSKKEGESVVHASWIFETISALIATNSLSCFSPEKQNKLNLYLENPILLENAYRDLQNNATQGSEEEGENIINAFWAFHTLSALKTTNSLYRLSFEQQNKIGSYFENPILIENVCKELQDDATRCSGKEGENTNSAFYVFDIISALISTRSISRLSPEKQNEINSYIENSILIENIFQYMQDEVMLGSKEEGTNTDDASYTSQTLSSLITVKDYLRKKGKKIDEEKFAKEALNPEKKIPPRPERRGY